MTIENMQYLLKRLLFKIPIHLPYWGMSQVTFIVPPSQYAGRNIPHHHLLYRHEVSTLTYTFKNPLEMGVNEGIICQEKKHTAQGSPVLQHTEKQAPVFRQARLSCPQAHSSEGSGNGSHSETLHTQKQHLRHHTFRDETNGSPVQKWQNKGKKLFLPFHS